MRQLKFVPVYRAAGSNLRMVRPSLMSVVKLSIICARSAPQNFGPSYFQLSGRHFSFKLLLCSLSLAVLNVSLYACARTYVPFRILLQQFILATRPHKSQSNAQFMSQLRLKMVRPWHGRTSRTGSGAYGVEYISSTHHRVSTFILLKHLLFTQVPAGLLYSVYYSKVSSFMSLGIGELCSTFALLCYPSNACKTLPLCSVLCYLAGLGCMYTCHVQCVCLIMILLLQT